MFIIEGLLLAPVVIASTAGATIAAAGVTAASIATGIVEWWSKSGISHLQQFQ